MRLNSFVSVASVIALASFASAEDAEVPSDVLALTKDTFSSSVNPESLILVEFYAPWCGHCKALAPHYEEAATSLKEKEIKLAKVDCVDQADLCQEYGVQGYPSLKVFRNGEPTDYSGARTADGIISYMVKQTLPAVSQVTASNLNEFQNADKIVVLAYVSSTTGAPVPEFSAAAQKNRDEYLFGITSDAEAISAAGVTPPAIVVYRNFDEHASDYPYPVSAATVSEIEGWVKQLSIPILGEVNGETFSMYAASGKPIVYLFVEPANEKSDEVITALKPVAAKYRSEVHFVWIDATKFGEHAKALNLAEPKWPSLVIQNLETQSKYPYDQNKPIEADAVSTMVADYLAGTLAPKLKSQPIPESQDENVFTLVGDQFDEVVFDDSKDVFIEIYATWCGHCKRLKPIWDSLGDHFAGVKDQLIIAKFEGSENDLPVSAPFRVSSFPTLKFKPAGSREFLEYNGDRELESFVAYVEEHAKNSLKPAVKAPENGSQATFEAPRDAHDEL
ncbi:thioredoxin-like protein [Suillus paluster]|uniref:thioredoxin-like protein n=1 Tax=Suillus paluster TaxID=48578 RepID=UPI001B8769F5|nr:thioredoxin-like protein [Suillus paluster]KAG1752745.1 thioredoxin-like protein [Suillus paluster]